jgi:3-hydroxyisobutyrate dehydrogenase-like beta-hydroxyacid dehydrogenase
MGSQVGLVLREGGARVVTCLDGRGAESARRAAESGIEDVGNLERVVAAAALIVSVVPPAAAEPLAAQVAEAIARANARPLYLEANAIGPETAERIAQVLSEAGAAFVDGAIVGSSRDLRGRTRFYLSGECADEVAALLAPLKTTVLGSQPGQASAFKVLYAGLTKGLSALGVELLAGAERLDLAGPLMDKLQADYPSVATFWEHNLPGLPPVAWRRAQEMAELAATLEHQGLTAHMAHAARSVLEDVARRGEAPRVDRRRPAAAGS